MESITIQQINTILEKFNFDEIEKYINTKINSFEYRGFEISNGRIYLVGKIVVDNLDEMCWRRAKRILSTIVGSSNEFNFCVQVDSITAEFVKPVIDKNYEWVLYV